MSNMLKSLLYPITFLYSIIIKFRNFLFDTNIIKGTYFNDVVVITIGNVTVGGTGKTPLAEYLIKNLKEKYKIAILSRGYKRKTKGFLYVSLQSTYEDVGDEPIQIANKHKDIIVAVCANRVKGIKKIKAENEVDIIILDDAFQHRKLIPKFSILLTTFNNPYFKDKFLPVGDLRDCRSQYKRAEIIISTKAPENTKPIERSIWKADIELMPYQRLFFSKEKYLKLKNVFHSNIQFDTQAGDYTILIVSGIANSNSFVDQIKNKYSEKIIHLKYRDHKKFSKKDIEKITTEFDQIKNKKIILTTEKDAMRLRNFEFKDEIKQKMFYLPIEIDFLFEAEKEFNSLILKSVKK